MARLIRSTAGVVLIAFALSYQPGHAQAPTGQNGQPAPAGQAAGQPAAQGQGGQAGQPPAADAPAQQDQQPIPSFRAGINFVRVDVIVSDRNGNPIEDLKPEDFEVFEQNTAQKIETFKLISLDGGMRESLTTTPRAIRTDLDEETEAARDDVRLFGIFLDDYHVRRETSMQARDQIARFVQTQLGPSDMIGLMYPLQPTASVRMTRNHAAIEKGIEQFMGRKYDYTPRNEMEERYAYYPAETVEQIRNQISMSAIKALILKMGSLKEGRKALLLVTEGYNAMLPPQMRDPVAAIPGIGNPNRNVPDAGVGSIAESRANFSSSTNLDLDLRDMWDLANKNNVAIYAIDPRGLATNEFGIDQNIGMRTDRTYLNATMETLRTLAINTDGRAIVNRNDLTLAMKQIVRDQSAYYLLGYNSTNTATDGRFHEIRVRVKRPGVQVRARKGYWAYTAADAAKATAPPPPPMDAAYATALANITTTSRSRAVRTWVGSKRAADGKTKMTLVWEAVPRLPGEAVRPTDVPARVSVTAVGPDGTPYYRGKVPGATATPPPANTSSKVSFDVPPGKLLLRLSVESAEADVIDTETREVEVPDLTGPSLRIGTPEIFRARTARDFQQLKANPDSAPTVAREFSRTERVFIRIPVFGPGDGTVAVTAKLLNRGGTLVNELPVTPSASDPATREIELTLASLSAGDYLVEIQVASPGEPVREVFGFRVTS